MTRGNIYKLLFILAVIAISVILILPTIGEKTMSIKLSEDVKTEQIDAIKKKFDTEEYSLEQKEKNIIVKGINLTDADMNDIKTLDGVENVKILKHWSEKVLLAKKVNLGLDLQGGMRLVLRANYEEIEEKMREGLEEKDRKDFVMSESEKAEITQQALELLRNRIDKFGVAEASIRPRGSEAIEVQLPGVKDPDAVKKVIGTTGSVQYRLVDDKYSADAVKWVNENIKDNKLPDDDEEQKVLINKISEQIKLPQNLELLFFFSRDKETKKIFPSNPMVLEKKVAVDGDDIQKAWISKDDYGALAVSFQTTAEGAAKFAEVTAKKNHGKRLAIVIDKKVRSAPGLNVQITSGQAQITGNFTMEEVKTLTRIIKEGALPVDLKIVEERTVGPSLGKDAIESGVKAIGIGLVAIVIFMMIYYKTAGIIAGIGLFLNMIFMMALLSLLGFTLTLPGFAGFILTVGMAVDANVIIYERIKEELRSGKSVRMSILYGYDKAFWTIIDANLTTIIAAFILSQYEIGPVKGFAVTLMIGILCTMFVSLYITRFIYEMISLNKKLKKLYI